MKHLQQDWLTQGLIDFEYKKYLLLAYLKNVREAFQLVHLYPYLSDLAGHYRQLIDLQEKKKFIQKHFPKEISKADFEQFRFEYQDLIQDDDLTQSLEEILQFAIPELQGVLNEGKDLYELVASQLAIEPVGLQSLYPEEGYFFINQHQNPEIQIFEYQITIFESAEERFRGIHTKQLDTLRRGLGESFEQLKLQLIRKRKKLPNPATFLINVKMSYPLEATLLPIAKRALVRHIYQKAA